MQEQEQQRPEVAPPEWGGIPDDLANAQQWLLWKFEPPDEGGKKWKKVPYYVAGGRRTGDQGSERDRHRLCVMSVARKAFERGGWDGVGFAFLPDDGLIGIDIDGAIDPDTGEVSKDCLGIVGSCRSFTEYSPSGKGVHIIVRGETRTNKCNDIGVEMFCGRQYFTVTGRLWPGSVTTVEPITPLVLDGLHAMIDRAKETAKAAKAPQGRDAAPRKPEASRDQPAVGGSGDDFTRVNDAAMRNFSAWVRDLLPAAKPHGAGYRATSKDLGRNYQEDLSIHPDGIYDFGPEQSYTPVDLVMEWLPTDKAVEAMRWLAQRLGIEVGGKREQKKTRATLPASAGGRGESDASAGGGGSDEPPADAGAAPEPEDDGGVPNLIKHRGKPVDCRENVLYCLRGDPALAGLVKLNTFSELHERSREVPWKRGPGEWDEEDDLMLGEYLAAKWGLLIKSTTALRQGVLMAAREHRYNPIHDLIRSVEWDGVTRLEHWLSDVFEVEDRPYTRLIGRCFIMGMVMRAMRPGCKFDYMLILKGEQGLQKSGAFRALAEPWFTDNAIRVGDKDSYMSMQLVWIAESAELESLNKAESTAVKQFLSAQEDMYRPPYGAQMKKRPRHTVMGGTTNADTFLKDFTGDRRFWPLEVKVVNLDALRAMRLQLFAEALHRLRQKEQYWPSKEEEHGLIFPEQEPFKKEERWEDYLSAYVDAKAVDAHDPIDTGTPRCQRDFFTTMELYGKALGIKAERIDGGGNMDGRIANAMKALGFVKHRQSTGLRLRGWLRVRRDDGDAPAGTPVPGASPKPPLRGPEAQPQPVTAGDQDDDDLDF